ncbi:Crp/Fnr family transcriptional regulator [Flagellimonas sp. CMM7]|uniref:Crp/Fnr family transcriptional regulator n=1 Tax=Flagellimonas sp. CMM7 TaxID=2654676 RepID=UPI0013D2C35F|nr:Crp/Fnr family transcriptional regulator [Flagellimonas sp. CMM7]UII80073.1 Crp/Fnr family transcriptional regulator [Flagellimonas sp. CMM7]
MVLKEKIRALISKFQILNKEEVEILVEKTVVDSFKKDTLLLKEGQIPTKCYMVVEGCVREYLIKDGEEKSTAFFMEGDTFTPHSHDSKPSKHYWECVEDCILTISNKSFEEEIRAALPRLEAVFQEIAIQKINKAKEEWSEFITSSPEERYLNLLETKPLLLNRIPQHQIASYLGMKPQSLSRIRKRLANKKV